MKLSVSSYSLARWRREQNKTYENTIDFIADQGVQGIEFSGLDEKGQANPIKRAAQLRNRAEKRGLKVVSYCIGAELCQPPDKQREVIDKLKSEIDVAAELGVFSMRHDVMRNFNSYPNFPGAQTFGNALKVIVPAIRELADYGQSKGLKTTLENHGFYMQQSTRVEKLIKTVNHPNFGLTMDMGNFLCVNENPTEAVARVAKYAVMCHTKDFHVRSKKTMPPSGWFATPTPIALRGAIVGHGVLDIPAQLKLLKKAKYNHYLSLEFEGMEEPTKAVPLGLEYLRKQLEIAGLAE